MWHFSRTKHAKCYTVLMKRNYVIKTVMIRRMHREIYTSIQKNKIH